MQIEREDDGREEGSNNIKTAERNKRKPSFENMEGNGEACEEPLSEQCRTVRSVAREFDVCQTTLYCFIKKVERLGPGEQLRTGYWTFRRIFFSFQ